MTRRIFVAAMATETNSFSPIRIDLRAFEASLFAGPGAHPETPTLCTAVFPVGRRVTARRGWTLVEGTAAWADPAGLVSRAAHESLRDRILAELAGAGPVDAVMLGLHGAMIADGCDDPEGDLLARIRAHVGPDVPVMATLDPHSHLTKKRVAAADALVAFREFPHTDFVATAERAWALMERRLDGDLDPVILTADPKMIDVFPTSRAPMRRFVDDMVAAGEDFPGGADLSLIHGFMAGDVPEMGTKMMIVADRSRAVEAQALIDRFAARIRALRGQVRAEELDVPEALKRAQDSSSRPVTIADMWDNPGGGTAGDATVLLRAVRDAGLSNVAFGTIWDPGAVAICMAAGAGAQLSLRIGAKSAPGTGLPVDLDAQVVSVRKDAHQMFGGSIVPIGDAAHIRAGGIDIILNSTRAQCFDTSLFTLFGIDPAARDILVVKSTNHFYDSFARLGGEILYCAAGTPYPNDPRRTAYRQAPRDIWPIADDPPED
ncbi:M81 family metallopeptidase [Oceanomicrobium pacificus]|uniref:Microcystinase C n=1 Tax=Oceanomicrobium pacificus TaxID=2692916 RepID=A0A6B0U0F4_9RHOB|nr:M81 family metallopeptidase [Oceanomicrobium pacificus]MXU66723.1 microcystin LR degradation protein MlrC-like protein [Oceanomicrobium pacificus]